MSIPVGRMMKEFVVEVLVSNTSMMLPVLRNMTSFRIGSFGIAVVSGVLLVVTDNDLTLPSRIRRSDLLVCTSSALDLNLAIDPYTRHEQADFDLWYVSLCQRSGTMLTLS